MPIKPGRNVAPIIGEGDTIRQRDLKFATYPFRFIEGGDMVERVAWPTQFYDEEEGEMVTTWRSVRLPLDNKRTFLDAIAAREKALRQELAVQENRKPDRCVFERRRAYIYAVFDKSRKDHRTNPKVVLFEVTSPSIAADITEYHTKPDDDDNKMLAYGPMMFYDIHVTKYQLEGKPNLAEWQRTRYKTEVRKNDWYGAVPVEYAGGIPEDFDLVAEGVFTEAEWEAICNSDLDIAQAVQPVAEEEMTQLLTQYPVDFTALSGRDNSEVFDAPIQNELIAAATKLGVPLLEEGSGTTTSVPKEPASKHDEDIQEAEVVDEEEGGGDVFLEGDTVWCEEDGEEVHYKVSSSSGGSCIIEDEEGNAYEVPGESLHLVEQKPKPAKKAAKKATTKKPSAPEFQEGDEVWADEYGEDDVCEFVRLLFSSDIESEDEEEAIIRDANGDEYLVPLKSLHPVSPVPGDGEEDEEGDSANEEDWDEDDFPF